MQNSTLRWIEEAQVPAGSGAVEAAERCLRDTGAIKRCTCCGERFVMAKDDGAAERAYARAEHLWKAGLRSFEGMTRMELVEAIETALNAAPGHCPSCR